MIPDQQTIDHAVKHLTNIDERLSLAKSQIGPIKWRTGAPNFESLCRLVVFQLISTKVAEKIWQRLRTKLNENISAQRLLDENFDSLKSVGLSNAKTRTLIGIAEYMAPRPDFFDKILESSDQDAMKILTSLKGIGPWTAKTFLIFSCGRLDLFPEGDVGMQQSYQLLCGLETRPTPAELISTAEGWRPYRSVAALLLWNWFNAHRDGFLKV